MEWVFVQIFFSQDIFIYLLHFCTGYHDKQGTHTVSLQFRNLNTKTMIRFFIQTCSIVLSF